MNKLFTSIGVLLLALSGTAGHAQSAPTDILNEDETTIRLLEGDNPDPSIIRYGSKYYMIHSSFVYTRD